MLQPRRVPLRIACIRSLLSVFLLGAMSLTHADTAATTTAEPTASPTGIAAYARAHAAVVGLRTTVSDDARSAESLGRQRSGSGVLIGRDGLRQLLRPFEYFLAAHVWLVNPGSVKMQTG